MNEKLKNLLLLLAPGFIFFPSFQYFFFQDDFLHLKRSFIENFSGFLDFLKPPSEAIYYRPLSLQLYFFVTRSLFGLNPLAFRLIAFLFFLLSIFLLKKVIQKITKDEQLSFVVAFFFGISSIHFISIFWICEFSVILGVFFLLLAFFYYPQRRALLFFILGLLSHELVMVLPFLLLFYELILRKRNFRALSLFFLLSFFYFLFRFLIFPIPLEGTYRLTLNKKNLSALVWYFLWSFNLPEELKYQSVLSKLEIRREFISSFFNDFIVWTTGLLTTFLFLLILPLIHRLQGEFPKLSLGMSRRSSNGRVAQPRVKNPPAIRLSSSSKSSALGEASIKRKTFGDKKTKRFLLFGTVWFLTAVFPLILAPFHQYPMYLAFALPGLYLTLTVWFLSSLKDFKEKSQKILLSFLLAVFFILSLTTVRFTEKTHWTVQEARRAKEILQKAKRQYPEIAVETIFLLPGDQQLKAALNDQDAFQVFYGNKVRVFYGEKEDLKESRESYKIIKLDES